MRYTTFRGINNPLSIRTSLRIQKSRALADISSTLKYEHRSRHYREEDNSRSKEHWHPPVPVPTVRKAGDLRPKSCNPTMASLITSHASIGNSTLKDAHDMTTSSFGGPEDFTLNIIDLMRRNKPSFKHTNREQLTTSSFGGPEDFTADIIEHANRTKEGGSSQRSKGPVIASMRQPSDGSPKVTHHLPPHSPIQSPGRRPRGLSSAAAANYEEPKPTKPYSSQPEASLTQAHGKKRRSSRQVKGESADFAIGDNGTVSIIDKDGKIYRKNMRAGVRQKMQPTVSDDEGQQGGDETTGSLNSTLSNQRPPEPTMSLSIDLLKDDLTKPLGESTPTQHTLDSIISSEEHTVEDGFEKSTNVAHRIQRTPASVKTAATNHSINMLVDASELLTDDMYRPETFPRNDSSVKNCSDPNVAIADRTRAIRSDNQSNTQRPPTSTKVDEMELLRKELEEMKSALAQKDEAINVLQSKLSVKEAECDELRNILQDKSSAVAAAESRETVLKDAIPAAEEKTASATATAAERFTIMKNALIAAEDEAAVAAERAKDAVTAAESRCHRLEKEVKDLTTSVRTARAEAKRAKKEQAERETMWMERSEILLAECDRRGRALMIKIGEQELPGVRDEKGRQAYRYQRRGEWDREHLVWQ